MNNIGTVYSFTNKINGKTYIGQTIKPLKERLRGHINSDNSLLGRAIRKHGIENFDFSINEVPGEFLDNMETNLIALYDSIVPNGYNFDSGGKKNKRHCEVTRQKISVSNKLFRNKMGKEYFSGENSSHYGKKHSAETKAIISAKNSKENHHFWGKHLSAANRSGISASHMGMKASPETRVKLSLAHKGKPWSEKRRLAELKNKENVMNAHIA